MTFIFRHTTKMDSSGASEIAPIFSSSAEAQELGCWDLNKEH